MSPEDLVERLSWRFRLLHGGEAAAARHRTLEAMVDWSYGLLDETSARSSRRCRCSPVPSRSTHAEQVVTPARGRGPGSHQAGVDDASSRWPTGRWSRPPRPAPRRGTRVLETMRAYARAPAAGRTPTGAARPRRPRATLSRDGRGGSCTARRTASTSPGIDGRSTRCAPPTRGRSPVTRAGRAARARPVVVRREPDPGRGAALGGADAGGGGRRRREKPPRRRAPRRGAGGRRLARPRGRRRRGALRRRPAEGAASDRPGLAAGPRSDDVVAYLHFLLAEVLLFTGTLDEAERSATRSPRRRDRGLRRVRRRRPELVPLARGYGGDVAGGIRTAAEIGPAGARGAREPAALGDDCSRASAARQRPRASRHAAAGVTARARDGDRYLTAWRWCPWRPCSAATATRRRRCRCSATSSSTGTGSETGPTSGRRSATSRAADPAAAATSPPPCCSVRCESRDDVRRVFRGGRTPGREPRSSWPGGSGPPGCMSCRRRAGPWTATGGRPGPRRAAGRWR